jgi:hypothetical protein
MRPLPACRRAWFAYFHFLLAHIALLESKACPIDVGDRLLQR